MSAQIIDRHNMAVINVMRRTNANSDGAAPLYAVFNINREKIRIALKLRVIADDWDSFNSKIKGRSAAARDNNLIISNTVARISDILVCARLRNEKLSKELFFKRYNNPSDFNTFHEFVDIYQKKNSKTMEFNTLKSHRSSMKKLQEYAPSLLFDDLTPEFILQYQSYLRKHYKNKDTTICKNLANIKVYILASIRAGYLKANPFDHVRIKKAKSDIIYLNEEELDQMISLFKSNLLEESQQNILRFFLFLCFTSLHIGDAKRLEISQVKDDFINYQRQKTRAIVKVPMSLSAIKLYDYYRSGRNDGVLFLNLPTDQDINRVLKKICLKAGITKPISAKAARHTFATLYYLKNKGDIGTLSNILGHSSLNMTMIYAHILASGKMDGIHVFDDML